MAWWLRWISLSVLLVIGVVLALLLVAVPGPAASAASPTTPMWAVVRVDGTLARGSGAASSGSLGADGQFQVVFGRNVSGCAYVATAGESTAVPSDDAISLSVAPRGGNPNAVFVQEWDGVLARDSASSGFHLVVAC